jgi:hypothetical protein
LKPLCCASLAALSANPGDPLQPCSGGLSCPVGLDTALCPSRFQQSWHLFGGYPLSGHRAFHDRSIA